ncbi:hypothetical protein [Nocardia sp. BMG51109]|uniref:hypothetical protein n=1 Tax=Nocardia sp. BMG51109 TaxID=1056816 RepID=UPI0004652AC8|nr:hypothetical protein [Nocardia sp. BMG51109]
MSLLDAPVRRCALRRRAEELGYYYVYTACPPRDCPDPIGYAITMATGIRAAAIIVYDLDVVDHSPARICDRFDLETVCPGETWARAFPPPAAPAAHPWDPVADDAESAGPVPRTVPDDPDDLSVAGRAAHRRESA